MYKSGKKYTPLNEDQEELKLSCFPSDSNQNAPGYYFKYFIQPLMAELIGVMFFVFVGVTCLSPIATEAGQIVAALAHGFILFVMVAITATASGGHLNPAVTLGLTIVRGLPLILAPFYVLAQLLGGIIGAALARAAMSSSDYHNVTGGIHQLGENIDPGQGILAEAVATSILVLAVLMVAFDENNKSVLAPLAIGLSVAGGIFAIGNISGASMNPARSFGPALVRNSWKNHYVYWVGPIIGSLFSTLMYGLFLASPNKLWLPIHEPVN
ncbi:aquaporin-8-like isoform X1 [Dendronephthya gigantea]|uniref:aquaporin-8-like isoform X1 n=1 Tax=Dendronephthya gigantea TaxID=151771 RepID=UPI00106CE741|nr:aquaporin-8-like isoform X1 [Dendronephthya gigantea]